MKLHNIIILLSALSLASCVNEPLWEDTNMVNGTRYSNFDFCSTFDCDVTLSLGRSEFVYIYTQDPTRNPNAEPVRTLWTDSDGTFQCRLTLPTALIRQQIYASTSRGVISADVTDKGASFRVRGAGTASRSVDDMLYPPSELCATIKDSYLAKMPRENVNNLPKLVETGDIAVRTTADNTQVLFTYLHSFGWNTNYIYYYYYKGEDPITPENRDWYIQKLCSDDRFLCTRGWGIKVENNVDGNPEHDHIKVLTTSGLGGINLRFCDVDKTSAPGTVEDDTWTPKDNSMIGISNPLYFYGDIDLNSNEYEYEDGVPFPKGYKIGLILKSVKYDIRDNLTDPAYTIPSESVNYFFSNPKLNKADKKTQNQIHVGRYWSSDEANDISRFVYGFEDSYFDEDLSDAGADYNFTDFLCMVSTNPAAYTIDVASLSSTYSSVSGTLLYEDLFPNQGDYDMNDVIVEYRKVKEFEKRMRDGSLKDCIRNLYVELTPVHYGAACDDYLYVNVNNSWNLLQKPQLIDFRSELGMDLKSVAAYNEYQLTSGDPKTLKSLCFYIIKDWRPYGQPVRDLALYDDDVDCGDIDVFLYVKNTNREVHITGKTCAGVNGSSNIDLDEYLRIYKAPQYADGTFLPWAMDIPIKSDGHGYRGFIPVTESVKITDEYLSFFDWFNGDKSKAWYENKYHTPVK